MQCQELTSNYKNLFAAYSLVTQEQICGDTIERTSGLSVRKCLEKCLITDQCKGVLYSEIERFCDLLSYSTRTENPVCLQPGVQYWFKDK